MLTVLDRRMLHLMAVAFAAAVAWLSASSPAHAIINGTRAPDTAAARSTVFVQTRDWNCSGTLVAPDLVLTAGHCLEKPEPASPLHPRFRPDPEDWQRPDRFYAVPGGARVSLGIDREAPRLTVEAPEYAIPGRADMLLLRLSTPVPAAVATPVPILTRHPGAGVNPTEWFRGLTLQVAGFGAIDESGTASRYLKQGVADAGEFPCTPTEPHKLCVQSADGSRVRGGDSGGPLYWTDSSGKRWLVAVNQGYQDDTVGRYTATLYRGGSKGDRTNLSNAGLWLDQFVRGRAGGLAFLRTTDPTADEIVAEEYASNPSGLAAEVRRLGVGRYEARFDGLRHTDWREPRVAIVTALGTVPAYCKLEDAAAADRVRVACYDSNGDRADARFALATDISDSDLLVRVPHRSSGSIDVPSAHGPVSVSRIAPGTYRLVATGLNGEGLKNVMSSAEGADDARCNPQESSTTSPSAVIRCLSADGIPVDSGFTMVATSGHDSAYALAHQEARSSYVATPARANIPGTDSKPTIQRLGTGRYRVAFTGAPANVGGNVHAAAYGVTSSYCAVAGWAATSADVWCRGVSGALADTKFVVRFLDPLDVGRRVEIGVRELHATSVDECGEMDMYGALFEPGAGDPGVDIPLVSNVDVRVLKPPVVLVTRNKPGERLVEATLRLRDQDGSCGGSSLDDEVDIAAGPGGTALQIQVDVQAHTVRMLDAFPQVLGGLGLWWSDGRDGLETARAELDVDIVSPTGLF